MSRTPLLVRNGPALRHALDGLNAKSACVALVPTSGALHDGLMSLVRPAQRRADTNVVSTCGNPTQFAPAGDFGVYPRTRKHVAALG